MNISKSASVFTNRNFMLLFSGKIISQLGDQIYAFALSWYILDRTKSGLQMALFLVVDSLAIAAISPAGGAIADRLSRKSIMVWMDAMRGALVAAAGILLYFQMLEIWMLYVSAIALGACGAIFNPASGAIIPNIVRDEQLPEATSMGHFSSSLCAMIGMLTGGILYAWIGMLAVFILNALSYLISGALEACIELAAGGARIAHRSDSVAQEARKILRELGEGYRYVRSDKLIFYLIIMFTVYNAIVVPLGNVYFPYFFNVTLKAAPYQLALSTGSIFIGMMIGAFLVPRFLRKFRLRDGIIWGLLALIACQVVFIAAIFTPFRARLDNWRITYLMICLSSVMGVAITFFSVPINVIFQKRASDEYRGRFWGFSSSLSSLSIPAGYLAGGILSQKVPLVAIFVASTLMFLLLDLWMASLKELRELGE
jgi:MFS transporter, DHA3 family, macrolide efflux protein